MTKAAPSGANAFAGWLLLGGGVFVRRKALCYKNKTKKTLGQPKVTGEKIVGKERGGRRRKRGKDAADYDSSRLMEMTVDRERAEDSRREADTQTVG